MRVRIFKFPKEKQNFLGYFYFSSSVFVSREMNLALTKGAMHFLAIDIVVLRVVHQLNMKFPHLFSSN